STDDRIGIQASSFFKQTLESQLLDITGKPFVKPFVYRFIDTKEVLVPGVGGFMENNAHQALNITPTGYEGCRTIFHTAIAALHNGVGWPWIGSNTFGTKIKKIGSQSLCTFPGFLHLCVGRQ